MGDSHFLLLKQTQYTHKASAGPLYFLTVSGAVSQRYSILPVLIAVWSSPKAGFVGRCSFRIQSLLRPSVLKLVLPGLVISFRAHLCRGRVHCFLISWYWIWGNACLTSWLTLLISKTSPGAAAATATAAKFTITMVLQSLSLPRSAPFSTPQQPWYGLWSPKMSLEIINLLSLQSRWEAAGWGVGAG